MSLTGKTCLDNLGKKEKFFATAKPTRGQ